MKAISSSGRPSSTEFQKIADTTLARAGLPLADALREIRCCEIRYWEIRYWEIRYWEIRYWEIRHWEIEESRRTKSATLVTTLLVEAGKSDSHG